MYDIVELNSKLVDELKSIASELKIPKIEKLAKQELIYKILDYQALNPTKEMLELEKRKFESAKAKKGPEKEKAKEKPADKNQEEKVNPVPETRSKRKTPPKGRPKKNEPVSNDKKSNPKESKTELTKMEDENLSLSTSKTGF